MPHHLLLADHSVTIQRVIKLTFADEDVIVKAVGDGNQAIAAIDESPPDIVLADVSMPGRSGYEVAEHVRTTPRLAHIPVVLLTGAFDQIDPVRMAALGGHRVLAKPFDPQAVVSCVRELLTPPGGATVPASTALSVDDAAVVSIDLEPLLSSDPGGVDLPFESAVDGASAPPLAAAADPGAPNPASRNRLRAAGQAFAAASARPPRLETQGGSTLSDSEFDDLAARVLDRLVTRLSAGAPDRLVEAIEQIVHAEIERAARSRV